MPNVTKSYPEIRLNATDKGVPAASVATFLGDVRKHDWNLLREDIPLPVAVLKDSALHKNSAWMRSYLSLSGAHIAPHGKTTMAPELFDLQIADGAWAITVSTPHQIRVARHFGHRRLFVANQLMGRTAIEEVFRELDADPGFEIYCLADSLDYVAYLSGIAEGLRPSRRLNLLVEIGFEGGRTGCRSDTEALSVAQYIHRSKHLALCGIEGFEGIIWAASAEQRVSLVRTFLDRIVKVAETCSIEKLFESEAIILSAGGSSFFDIVVGAFQRAQLSKPPFLLIRSGCYLTHDSFLYKRAFAQMTERSPALVQELGGLEPALEVWAYVQSRPEQRRAIATLGKRDISYDDLPVPLKWYRPTSSTLNPMPISDNHKVVRLDDQHCYLDIPVDSPLRVGDMLAFGMSHPCLTFDKWRVLHRVDDDYSVIGSLRTYF